MSIPIVNWCIDGFGKNIMEDGQNQDIIYIIKTMINLIMTLKILMK